MTAFFLTGEDLPGAPIGTPTQGRRDTEFGPFWRARSFALQDGALEPMGFCFDQTMRRTPARLQTCAPFGALNMARDQ